MILQAKKIRLAKYRGFVNIFMYFANKTPTFDSVAGLFFAWRIVQSAVVGDGERLHSETFGLVHQVGNTAYTVKHAVFGVYVQMSEHELVGLPLARRFFLRAPNIL